MYTQQQFDNVFLIYFSHGIKTSTIFVESQRTSAAGEWIIPIYVARLANNYVNKSDINDICMNPYSRKKTQQMGHRASIFDDFLGMFCVNPIFVSICVASCYLSNDYFFIFNLCSTPCHLFNDYFFYI